MESLNCRRGGAHFGALDDLKGQVADGGKQVGGEKKSEI